MEENSNPTKSDLAGAEKGPCCVCPKTPEEKDRERDERVFLKVFENFLHNAIFLPRYSKQQLERSCTALLSLCGDHQTAKVTVALLVCLHGSK